MTEEDYTNMDLATADELLVQAGYPAIAKALRFQTQGNRNLIQGEWGQKVVSAFENILQVHVVNALASVQRSLDEQHDMVERLLAMQKASDKNAKQALAVAKETGRGLKKLRDELMAQGQRLDASEADRRQLNQRISNIERLLEARPAQREIEHQAILDAIAAERGGDG